MITNLRFQNFKSWLDTGDIRFAPITGFFGANSSGKTAILHFLLMLKQTVESSDNESILNLSGPYTDLGISNDVIHNHTTPKKLEFQIRWNDYPRLSISTRQIREVINLFPRNGKNFYIELCSSIYFKKDNILINNFNYKFIDQDNKENIFGIKTTSKKINFYSEGYHFTDDDVYSEIDDSIQRSFFRFPIHFRNTLLKNKDALEDIVYFELLNQLPLEFTNLFRKIQYLGPLRDFPKRIYRWAGERYNIGNEGENAIFVLLQPHPRLRYNPTLKVAKWLRELGLIHSFELHRIAKNRQEYEVKVRVKEHAQEVLLTEVGFGVSQILPVLVACATTQEGTILIFEQPEIHLHPAVQAGLADIFIETIKERKVQIILESHSEHLLSRLQRRIAEEQLDHEQTALYFCATNDKGTSQLTSLDIDEYGNISNWPQNFFGDEMGDVVAMTTAAMERQKRAKQ